MGRTVTTGYDADGRPVTVTDPAGNVTTTAYNAVGWTTSVVAPGSGRTRYFYDRVGNLTKRTDPLGSETTYTYDAAGRALTQTDPLGRVTTMAYDAVGNVAQVVKPSGTATVDDTTDGIVSYAYDAANRPVATSFSDDTAGFTYAHSAAGRLLSAARVQNGGVSASSAYTYDAAGRKTSEVRTGPGGSNANYSYTNAGRLAGASWSTGMSVAYSYNQVGELTTVTPSGTGSIPAVDYAYDPSGRVSTVKRQSQSPVTTSAVYDAAGQLASLQNSSTSGVLDAYGITRDTRGNPTQVDTTTSAGTTSALYTYDAVSRLRSECYPVTGDVCVAKSPRNAYTYDLVGNRATETSRTVVGTKATTVVTDYTYDAAYQLLTESVAGTATVTNTWSANGALATSTTPAGTQTYTTDLTDELISLTLEDGSTVGYTQDASGNRTSRTVDGLLDATWAWDDLSSLPMRIGEYDHTGTLTTGWLADPTSSTGASLAQTSGGVSSWLLSDPFANTVATVSTTGNTVSGTRTMDAFGVQRTSSTGSLADASVGFAGQYLDAATGLYDMRARDYDPTSGRFTATDPVDVSTGSPYFAGYSYAHNNPLMYSDASGREAACAHLSGVNSQNACRYNDQVNRIEASNPYLEEINHDTPQAQLDLLDIRNNAANRADSCERLMRDSGLAIGLGWLLPDFGHGSGVTVYSDGDKIVEDLKRSRYYTGPSTEANTLAYQLANSGKLYVGETIPNLGYTHFQDGASDWSKGVAATSDVISAVYGLNGETWNNAVAAIGTYGVTAKVMEISGTSVTVRVTATNNTTLGSALRVIPSGLRPSEQQLNGLMEWSKGLGVGAMNQESQALIFTTTVSIG